MNIPLFLLMRLHLFSVRTQVILGVLLALMSMFIMPFGTVNAAVPAFTPGNSSFPYAAGGTSTTTPSGTFPYANQGLEAGLNAVESNLPQGIQKQRSATQLIKDWINYFLQFYMFVTVGLLLYYGFQILISRDKTEKRKEVVGVIVNILLGTLLMVFAYAIIIAIVNLFTPQDLKNGVTPTNLSASAPASTDPSTMVAACSSVNEIRSMRANFYAYPAGKDSMIVEWSPCVKTGKQIQGYILEVSENGGLTWKGETLTTSWGVTDLAATTQRIYFNGASAAGLDNVPFNPTPPRVYQVRVKMKIGTPEEIITGPAVVATIPQ